MADENLLIDVGVDLGNSTSQLGKLDHEMSTLHSSLDTATSKGGGFFGMLGGGAGKVLGLATGIGAVVGIGGGLVDMFKDGIDQADQWNAAMAQTDAVIKSTGGAAGVTKDQVSDLANSLSANGGLSAFADDAVASGENLLLTFTNIGKDVFPEVTQTMLDMSAAMGQDMKTSAIQLGKALNDPTKGITALTRVGVTFTAEQKEQIKTLQASGDTMGAQKIILAELGKEFGGSALAGTKSFSGQMAILGEKFNNVKQSIGDALMPALQQLISFVGSDAVMGTLTSLIDTIGNGLSGAVTFLGNVMQAFQGNGQPLLDFFNSLGGPDSPMAAVGTFIVNLIANINAFVTALQSGQDPIQAFGNLISGNFGAVMNLASSLGQMLLDALPGIIDTLGQWGQAFVDWIGPKIPPMLAALGDLLQQLGSWIWDVGLPWLIDHLVQWGQAFIDWVGPQIPPLLAALGDLLQQVGAWIWDTGLPWLIEHLGKWGQAFIDWVGPQIQPLLQKLWELDMAIGKWIVEDALPTIIQKLGEWGKAFIDWIGPNILPMLAKLGELEMKVIDWILFDAVPAIDDALKHWVSAFLDWIGDVLQQLPGKLFQVYVKIGEWINENGPRILERMKTVGWSIVQGIMQGIINNWELLTGLLSGRVQNLVPLAMNVIEAHSPSRAFMVVGAAIVDGLKLGIDENFFKVFDSLKTAMNGMVDKGKEAADQAKQIGVALIDGVKAGVDSKAEEMVGTLQAALYTLAIKGQELTKNDDAIRNIGRYLSENLLTGVKEYLQPQKFGDIETGLEENTRSAVTAKRQQFYDIGTGLAENVLQGAAGYLIPQHFGDIETGLAEGVRAAGSAASGAAYAAGAAVGDAFLDGLHDHLGDPNAYISGTYDFSGAAGGGSGGGGAPGGGGGHKAMVAGGVGGGGRSQQPINVTVIVQDTLGNQRTLDVISVGVNNSQRDANRRPSVMVMG